MQFITVDIQPLTIVLLTTEDNIMEVMGMKLTVKFTTIITMKDNMEDTMLDTTLDTQELLTLVPLTLLLLLTQL